MSSKKSNQDEYLELFELIGVLGRKRYMFAAPYLVSSGFSPTEARLLTLIINHGGPISQDELSSKIHLDRTNVGRGLKKLEQQGYVTRLRDEKDRRANFVTATPNAKKEASKIHKIRIQAADDFLGHLNSADVNSLTNSIKKVLKDER